MSGILKKGTIHHSEMVSSEELKLRELGKSIPEFYRLNPHQMTHIEGYVDSTYTKVKLLDGRVIDTRTAMNILPKYKSTNKSSGYNTRIDRTAINLQTLYSDKTTYRGLKLRYVTFTWYAAYSSGRITITNPVEDGGYLLDCYLVCDCKSSWNYLQEWLATLFNIAVNSLCDMELDGEKVDRVAQLHRLCHTHYKGVQHSLGLETENIGIPPSIQAIFDELRPLNLRNDDPNISMDTDVKTLLTLIKLAKALEGFKQSSTRNMYKHISLKLRKKPYLKSMVKMIFCSRPSSVNEVSYVRLIKRLASGMDVEPHYADFNIGIAVYYRLLCGQPTYSTLPASLISKLQDSHTTNRIKATLALMGVTLT